jgi:hypothetical protein
MKDCDDRSSDGKRNAENRKPPTLESDLEKISQPYPFRK